MARTGIYALQDSDLNRFVFADIGVEATGMTLSVLSTLSRLGMDPWQEAGRLARLPRASAIEGLSVLISTMPASLWPLPEARTIAARLVALLPGESGLSLMPAVAAGTSSVGGRRLGVTTIATWLDGLRTGRGNASARPGAPSALKQWRLVLVLLAVLVGLTLYLAELRGPAWYDGAVALWSQTAPAAAPAADRPANGK